MSGEGEDTIPSKYSPRKLQIEQELMEMNELLSIMIQKPDNSAVYQRNIIFFLRAVASIRERMLVDESGDDACIKDEIHNLERQARICLSSLPMDLPHGLHKQSD